VETKKYSNTDYKFSFAYPAKWELRDDVTMQATAGGGAVLSVGAFDSAGTVAGETLVDGVVVSLYKLNRVVDESVMPQIRSEVENVVSQLEQQQGLKIVEPLQETTLSGIPGYKVTYSFPMNEVPLKSTIYFLFSGSIEYQLSLQSAEQAWDKLKPEFDAVTGSFSTGV
jgi:hypothetical protein